MYKLVNDKVFFEYELTLNEFGCKCDMSDQPKSYGQYHNLEKHETKHHIVSGYICCPKCEYLVEYYGRYNVETCMRCNIYVDMGPTYTFIYTKK